MADAALQGAARGASYNVVLQLAFRVITFAVNAVILRYTSSAMLGVVNVRLTLLYSTLLFVSREPVRKTCLSVQRGTNGVVWSRIVNTSWLAAPIGCLLAAILVFVWSNLLERPDVEGYDAAVLAFALSAVLELLIEPLWILAQIEFIKSRYLFKHQNSGIGARYIRLKVAAEGLALTAKCLVTIALLMVYPSLGLWAFSAAQLAHSITLALVYTVCFAYEFSHGAALPVRSIADMLPKASPGTFWLLDIPPDLSGRVWNFWKQSLLKQFLTEGEGFVMTFLGILSFSEQGVYNIINNLGSLVPRFLFAPIEETFFTFFAGKLGRGGGNKDKDKAEGSAPTLQNVTMAATTLQTLLAFVCVFFLATGVHVSLVIAVFAQAYSSAALYRHIYGGSVLSEGEGPLLLRTYAAYIVFLAFNGVTECFMFACMTNEEVNRHNIWMIGFSGVFLLAAWQLTTYLGSVGFILANCINMFTRSSRSFYFIAKFFRGMDNATLSPLLWGFGPSTMFTVVLATALVVTKASEEWLCCSVGKITMHIGVGAVMFAAVGLVVYIKDRSFLVAMVNLYCGRRSPEQALPPKVE